MPRRLSPCGDSRRQGCATGPIAPPPSRVRLRVGGPLQNTFNQDGTARGNSSRELGDMGAQIWSLPTPTMPHPYSPRSILNSGLAMLSVSVWIITGIDLCALIVHARGRHESMWSTRCRHCDMFVLLSVLPNQEWGDHFYSPPPPPWRCCI